MKKAKLAADELRAEYKRSDFKTIERGKYAERVRAKSNVVVLEPELAAVFENSAAVNQALQSLVDVARKASDRTRSRPGRSRKARATR